MKIGVSEGYWDLTTVDVEENGKREGCVAVDSRKARDLTATFSSHFVHGTCNPGPVPAPFLYQISPSFGF